MFEKKNTADCEFKFNLTQSLIQISCLVWSHVNTSAKLLAHFSGVMRGSRYQNIKTELGYRTRKIPNADFPDIKKKKKAITFGEES